VSCSLCKTTTALIYLRVARAVWLCASHGGARLTAAQVTEIRRRVLAGESRAALAAEFGVNKSTTSRIARMKAWVKTA
jgi:hypothetical protein